MPSVSASWLAAKRAVVGRQLADHVVERARRDVAVARVAGQLPGVQVDPRELGVVVEHLLEVRDQPARRPSSSGGSRRRAGRACPPSAIASSERRAMASGRASPVARCRRSRNSIVIGCGNLGARPQPPLTGSNDASIAGRGRLQQRLARVVRRRPASSRCLLDQALDQPAPGRLHLGPLLAPGSIHTLEHLAERRHAVARLVREVGAAVERPAVRGQEDATSASRRCRSSPGPRPCRPGRGPAAPRGPP